LSHRLIDKVIRVEIVTDAGLLHLLAHHLHVLDLFLAELGKKFPHLGIGDLGESGVEELEGLGFGREGYVEGVLRLAISSSPCLASQVAMKRKNPAASLVL